MGPFLLGILLLFSLMVVVMLVIAAMGVSIYNRLVTLRNDYKNQFSLVDVQLKRRHDLIPNVVETAKGYMAHERGTLDEVVAARDGAVAMREQAATNPTAAAAMQKVASAEGTLSQSLGRLFAVAEAYPDLKANQTMLQLQAELTETENRIALSRQGYNESVRVYNTEREIFPNALLAGMFNFAAAPLYEMSESGERDVPKVSFT
jgi:LemA protein